MFLNLVSVHLAGAIRFSPQGNGLKEFSMDIDLRPEKELITRVSAKLDTLRNCEMGVSFT
jgi:hypothetical protein